MKLSWVLALVLPACAAYGADDVATYTATYRVEYKGKQAGTAEFGVRALPEGGVYEFSSRTMAKGLLKLARPNPAVERSQFRIENGVTECDLLRDADPVVAHADFTFAVR